MKKLLLGILTLGFVFSCGGNKTETILYTIMKRLNLMG